jgi:hypothetical protein
VKIKIQTYCLGKVIFLKEKYHRGLFCALDPIEQLSLFTLSVLAQPNLLQSLMKLKSLERFVSIVICNSKRGLGGVKMLYVSKDRM